MTRGTIEVQGLTREFRTFQRGEGFKGAWQNLWHRDYKTVQAVADVSFAIQPGEIVGYIGPNGAGKSTTVKMLTGIVTPTTGTVRVNGRDPFADRIAHTREIGVVFGQRTQLWWDLAVIEALRLLQRIYELDEATFQARIERFSAVLDLGDFLHTQVRKLSLGQRMRCDLAASLLHDPPVVFLDEPTIGLDVAVKARIRTFIREVNRDSGTTFILTTHDLGDIEELCRRVMVIDGGSLLYDGPLADMKAAFGSERVLRFDLSEHRAIEPLLIAIGRPDLKWSVPAPGCLEVRFDGADANPADLISRVMAQIGVADLQLQETSIETIVRRLYDKQVSLAGLQGAPPR